MVCNANTVNQWWGEMAVQGDGLGGNYFELDGIVFLKSCWHCVYPGENGEYSITLQTCAL